MALVQCKECGHRLSTASRKCPNCGAKKRDAIGYSANERIVFRIGWIIVSVLGFLLFTEVDKSEARLSSPGINLFLLGVGMFIIGFIMFFVSLGYTKREDPPKVQKSN